jgi:uncharacterized membrane protein
MLRQFSIALLTFVILDGLWLGLVMKDFYRASGTTTMTVVDILWGTISCAAVSWIVAALSGGTGAP